MYHQPPQPGEINLIDTVRTILMDSGLGQSISDAYDADHHIVDAQGKNVEVQRHMLNRYWNLQLMSCSEPSHRERYFLIPNGEIEAWIKMFKEGVVPFCIRNKLPKRL